LSECVVAPQELVDGAALAVGAFTMVSVFDDVALLHPAFTPVSVSDTEPAVMSAALGV
jgi:hypothetical protein